MMHFDRFAIDTVDVGQTSLHVRHAGQGEAVLLMHGWCGSSHSWRRLAPRLARDHRVIVPDMRGNGWSKKPDSGYDARSGARDMKGLLDRLGVETAHVVGHDMGAPVALLFAADFPGTTRTLTYVDEPILGFDTERYTAFTDWNHGGYWQFGLHNTPGMPELFYRGREEKFLRLIYSHMTVNKAAITDADVAEHALGMKEPNGIRGMTGWYRAVAETGAQIQDLSASGAVRVPTLYVRGEGGVPGDPDAIRQAVPHARSVTIPDCGHLVAEEQPEALEAVLREHFANVPSGRATIDQGETSS
ncbi:MAG: alpha/beta hydrolase [Methylobacteriaceae bacterium]|nr:alpha/beta hydrolase [Methylobacteriaceae bacterium]